MKLKAPHIPGVDFDFGAGHEYVLPPLTLGALRNLRADIDQLSTLAMLDNRAIEIVQRAVFNALQRNYTRDDGTPLEVRDLDDLIDVSQLQDLMAVVLDVSGLQRKVQDAKKRQTQLMESTMATSAGTGSSPASASTQDGPGTTSAVTST